jgi:LmbE family N-acetylglucosaminyl deacetylase
MATLGVEEHHWLDFEDGTLEDVPLRVGAALVSSVIAAIRPDTVVTFGPDGMTGHPDHRAVSAWVAAATLGPARVLHSTTTAAFADEFADLHAELGVFGDRLPVRTPDDDVAVEVLLDDDLADLKLAALRAHASQVQPIIDAIGADGLRNWWRAERFVEMEQP